MYTKILEVEYLRTKGNDIIFPVIKDKLTYCSIDTVTLAQNMLPWLALSLDNVA